MVSVRKQSRILLNSTNASITNPRLIFLGVLLREARPLTIDQVLKLTRGKLAQSTLYRVINDLKDLRLVTAFTNSEKTMVIELNDSLASHHHHIFCRKCNSITDIELNPELEQNLEAEVKRIESEHHIAIDSHSLELFATCKTCGEKE
jgi:Fe2+ or Zn2+ uptake regulation protein